MKSKALNSNHLSRVVCVLVPVMLLAACDKPASDAGTGTPNPGPTEAAAAGIAETLGAAAAGNPIPREGLPDFVETMPGGRYLTGMKSRNDLRSGGMMMYAAQAPLAEVVTFHRNSMESQGMTVGEATTRPVRDHQETSFEGRSADGKSRLTVVIIDKSEPEQIVQMNYTVEAG